jgi:hypothetical protein
MAMYMELQKLWRKINKISSVSGKVQSVKEDGEFNSVNAVIKGDISNESRNSYDEKYAKLSVWLWRKIDEGDRARGTGAAKKKR